MEEPRLISLAATPEGGLRMHFAPGPMLQLWASEMTKLLKDHNDAPNYVECSFADMETGQPWTLLVQKEDGLSPGMKASMATVRAERSEARVEELEEVLRSVEWHGDFSDGEGVCPSCGANREDGMHSHECRLATVLGVARESEAEPH